MDIAFIFLVRSLWIDSRICCVLLLFICPERLPKENREKRPESRRPSWLDGKLCCVLFFLWVDVVGYLYDIGGCFECRNVTSFGLSFFPSSELLRGKF